MAPRFSDQWEALAFVAGKMVEARAGKPDAPIWQAIAADWQWVVTHEGEPGFGRNVEGRIAATATAAERARKPLAGLGIKDPALIGYADRLQMSDDVVLPLEKYELLTAIAWHEARLMPSGQPMIAFVTDFNIQLGRGPHGNATLISLDDEAIAGLADTPKTAPVTAPPPQQSPAPAAAAAPRPRRDNQPQQASLL